VGSLERDADNQSDENIQQYVKMLNEMDSDEMSAEMQEFLGEEYE